jgi:proline racemase
MANATITAITENVGNLSVSVAIGGATYTAIVPKASFDAMATTADKQNYIIAVLAASRRVNRLYENIYPALIGAVIVIPD